MQSENYAASVVSENYAFAASAILALVVLALYAIVCAAKKQSLDLRKAIAIVTASFALVGALALIYSCFDPVILVANINKYETRMVIFIGGVGAGIVSILEVIKAFSAQS